MPKTCKRRTLDGKVLTECRSQEDGFAGFLCKDLSFSTKKFDEKFYKTGNYACSKASDAKKRQAVKRDLETNNNIFITATLIQSVLICNEPLVTILRKLGPNT